MSPREESNSLLNDAIEMALRLTAEHGSHMPFCMAIAATGERVNIAADDTLASGYDELYQLVQSQVREGASTGVYRAVAVARHVTFRASPVVPPGTEAVQITLDHVNDSACTCYLPYTVHNDEIQPGELFATDPVETYFPSASSPPEQKVASRPGLFSRLFRR